MANSALFGVLLTIATALVRLFPINLCLENLASILEVDEKLNMYFNIYSDAPENERQKEMESSLFGGAGGANKGEDFFI